MEHKMRITGDARASRLGFLKNATLRNAALCRSSWNSRLPRRHMH